MYGKCLSSMCSSLKTFQYFCWFLLESFNCRILRELTPRFDLNWSQKASLCHMAPHSQRVRYCFQTWNLFSILLYRSRPWAWNFHKLGHWHHESLRSHWIQHFALRLVLREMELRHTSPFPQLSMLIYLCRSPLHTLVSLNYWGRLQI